MDGSQSPEVTELQPPPTLLLTGSIEAFSRKPRDLFSFALLPLEIRRMVYRFIFCPPGSKMVHCRYELHRQTAKTMLYCLRPLEILQVSSQIRQEASTVLYGENVFVMGSSSGREFCVNLDRKTFRCIYLDLGRVKTLHMCIGHEEHNWGSHIRCNCENLRSSIKAFVDALPVRHQLQSLLIEAPCLEYDSGYCPPLSEDILAPLEKLRSIKLVHIRSALDDYWPVLRSLERKMMSNDKEPFGNEAVLNKLYDPSGAEPLY